MDGDVTDFLLTYPSAVKITLGRTWTNPSQNSLFFRSMGSDRGSQSNVRRRVSGNSTRRQPLRLIS